MPKAAKESSSSSSSVRRPYGIGLGQPPVKDMPLFLPDPDEQEAVLSRPTTPHKRQNTLGGGMMSPSRRTLKGRRVVSESQAPALPPASPAKRRIYTEFQASGPTPLGRLPDLYVVKGWAARLRTASQENSPTNEKELLQTLEEIVTSMERMKLGYVFTSGLLEAINQFQGWERCFGHVVGVKVRQIEGCLRCRIKQEGFE